MKLKQKILLIALIPLLILGVAITVVSNKKINDAMKVTISDGLRGTATAVRSTFRKMNSEPYTLNENNELVKGDFNISQQVDLADDIKEVSDIDVSIYFGDTRYMTSAKDASGQRVLGTLSDTTVKDNVLGQGKEYFTDNVQVSGQQYFGYYIPLFDFETGETVGMVFAGMQKEIVDSQIRQITMIIVALAVVLMIFCAVLIFMIVGKMSKRLSIGVNALEEVAQGKLNFKFDDDSLRQTDEVGEICRAIKKLEENLSDIIKNVISGSKELLEASDNLRNRTSITSEHVEQMEKAVNEIAIGAGSQAEETQSATENIILMGNMIEEAAGELDNLNHKARNLKAGGEAVMDVIRELQESNAKTGESIDIIYEQTNVTNESAQKIKEATALITNIAEETNLLSLNASIEAARAGEQGRGFAVVAAQIQKLAEQSNESARQIERIILSLIEDSDKSVITMNEVKEIMEQQSQNVMKTNEQVAQLVEEVEQSIGVIDEVSAKTAKINEARSSVVDTVQNLSAIAEENAASTEETSASVTEISGIINEIADEAHELKTISNQMDETMSMFVL
ncbi:MAG: methyl-accepting chemotaxis protein [Lachnospiraceae bacterium]|jgi:methyl-accepting chemotaxis protein|nr:methyl-accepting chemotaxis protein [Lachnospiraceae bacterium]MCI8987538.1 methyl-accepting chemotaxis protein [Lachnospiraceae bacterium]MCI9013506.1 methyl-accepting chemotaxis protein [Lachnospiraceae bacterium]MCI9256141.1 methyl-accepting chemotaxis protein [Lachnospiraceae bacterium]